MTGKVPEGLLDHAGIDKAFAALIGALANSQKGDVTTLFNDLAFRLRGHLEREESYIARFADIDAEDAKVLLGHHDGFRTALDELAASLEAGTLTEKDVRSFRASVALHESHEETGLYRWMTGRTP
jgi:hypothetical protein